MKDYGYHIFDIKEIENQCLEHEMICWEKPHPLIYDDDLKESYLKAEEEAQAILDGTFDPNAVPEEPPPA